MDQTPATLAAVCGLIGIPEPGQLVEVRRRQWVVADIIASEPINSGYPPQHMVTLSSIDEDGLGEELQVVCEIEPGAHVIEKAGLPEISGFDDADRLDAFLDAVRWGAATSADRGFLIAAIPLDSRRYRHSHRIEYAPGRNTCS
jgi:hypothetical protein